METPSIDLSAPDPNAKCRVRAIITLEYEITQQALNDGDYVIYSDQDDKPDVYVDNFIDAVKLDQLEIDNGNIGITEILEEWATGTPKVTLELIDD